MITDKFPLNELNAYYVGMEFIRISPITKSPVKGIVKEISAAKTSHTLHDIYYVRPELRVISTQNVDYDFHEVYFNTKTDSNFREQIVRKVAEDKEREKLEKIVE